MKVNVEIRAGMRFLTLFTLGDIYLELRETLVAVALSYSITGMNNEELTCFPARGQLTGT